MGEQVSEAWLAAIVFANECGIDPDTAPPGLWEKTVGDWTIRVNPHAEEIDNVPPLHVYAELRGWPAGMFGPYSGTIVNAGEGATEDAFIAALAAGAVKEES